MYTKKDALTGEGFWVGLGILAIGIAIGSIARPSEWILRSLSEADDADVGTEPTNHASTKLHPYLLPPDERVPSAIRATDMQAAPDNELQTLRVNLPPESAEVLQRVRDRALMRGVIIQEDGDTVPAEIELDGKRVSATVRIKGDWLDHVDTDRWSLRIKLKKKSLLGMSVFSIQAPKTRGIMWEWLALAIARREGVLAPRATFVNVEINGHPAGIYYLEEHFSKELLESQKRREGPIVRWDESTHWSTLLQSHAVQDTNSVVRTPSPLSRGLGISAASVRAYDEKRLAEIESLSRGLLAATEQMRELRALASSTRKPGQRAWLLKELSELEGAEIESVVNVELVARHHAIASLLQVHHGVVWQNLRFYHDPVLDRLEPIAFDNMPHRASEPVPVMFRTTGLVSYFARSRRYYEGVFRELGRFCHPAWLDEAFAEFDPELSRFESALAAEGSIGSGSTIAGMKQRIRKQQGFLRTLLYPADPLNVEAFYEIDEESVSGIFEVVVWATSRSPTVVEGFRMSNGSFVGAADHLVDDADLVSRTDAGGIVLPYDGPTIRFRFPIDQRLAGLETARGIKRAIRDQTNSSSLDFDVDIVFRSIATNETESETLRFRRYDDAWRGEIGRPEPPSFEDALEQHPFLGYDVGTAEIETTPGEWDVAGDLIVPRGYTLRINAGTTLRFEPDALLLSESPVHIRGTEAMPVVLEPVAGAESWRGIVILNASERSLWNVAVIRNTNSVQRKGWTTTGGITFYRSRVTMNYCLIEGTLAEDGCNFFATDISLQRVKFVRCASDSLDGDFVTGTLTDCVFEDGLADGVDFSGSDVEIVRCSFVNMGDKAISVGEDSRVRVRGGFADGVSIGIASKDRSHVAVDDMKISGARNYALAVFVKKDEFGPASLVANNVTIGGSGLGDTLVQTGCELTLNGTTIATEDLDVRALYRDKVLGQ